VAFPLFFCFLTNSDYLIHGGVVSLPVAHAQDVGRVVCACHHLHKKIAAFFIGGIGEGGGVATQFP
jgi:hypothetical protein